MTKLNSSANGSASLRISELMIGNLMVLSAGILGYLTGLLTFIFKNTKGQPQGGNSDATYHFYGKLRS